MTDYAKWRLGLLDALLSGKADVAGGRPWTLEPAHLRFKHGESLTELKLPYHMGGEDEACVEEAVSALAAILSRRYEPRIEGGEAARFLAPIGVLKDKTFRTDLFISESLEKEAACLVLAGVPYLDSAMLANWLGSEGQGRKFIRWANGYFEKMLRDEVRSGGHERTSYISLLALMNTVRKKKEKIKGVRIKGLSYEKLDLAVGMTMFLTLRTALSFLLRKLSDSGEAAYTQQAGLILLSALSPKSLLAIPDSLVSSTVNPYGVSAETFEALSSVTPGLGGAATSAELAAATASAARKDEAVFKAVRAQADINRFRRESLAYLAEFDLPGSEVQSVLYELYNEDRLIRNFLLDQKSMAALAAGIEEIKRTYGKDQRRNELLGSFLRFLTGFRKSMLGGLLKGPRKNDDIAGVIDGYCACAFDDHIERYAGAMRGCLADRREEFKHALLIEEFNRGRLYRFSADDRPVLRALTTEEEGQLFIDMKDFSKKTFKVKEIAMAEFMREHFYKPILNAASRYAIGSGVNEDERGIRLTNLPGDAAIFSGGVSYLVALARDIQHVIRRYREELLRRLPPRQDEELLEEVHRRFAARKESLRSKRAELNAALARSQAPADSGIVALGEEEHRLENTYREELEAAIKGELEAGLYISYGAKAETTVMEPREEFSAPVSVSIGEKINEAARGTFRNPMVRARLELSLENERARRKKADLRYPFDVYIDRVISLKLPPELDGAFEKLVSSGRDANAKAMAQVMASEFFSDLNRITSGEPFSNLRVISCTTDIYNKGEALSASALEAYMKEAKGSKWFFRKSVQVGELDPSIQEAFFFPFTPLDICFSLQSIKGVDRMEAFCRIGEVMFKGFEASTPTTIYELLNPEGEFFKALMKQHFQKWLEESRLAGAAGA